MITHLRCERNRFFTALQSYSVRFALLGAICATLAGPVTDAKAQISFGDYDCPVDQFWCDAVIAPEELASTINPPITPDALTVMRNDNRPLNAPYPLGGSVVTWTIYADGRSETCDQKILVFNNPGGCPTPRFATINLRDAVIAVRNNTRSDLSKLNAAINYLNKALEPARWVGEFPKEGSAGEGVFSNQKSAAGQLVPLKGKYPDLVAVLYRLVDMDRDLVLFVLGQAVGGNASKITTARNYLAKADAYVAAGQFTNAIDAYKTAWKNAMAAF